MINPNKMKVICSSYLNHNKIESQDCWLGARDTGEAFGQFISVKQKH